MAEIQQLNDNKKEQETHRIDKEQASSSIYIGKKKKFFVIFHGINHKRRHSFFSVYIFFIQKAKI